MSREVWNVWNVIQNGRLQVVCAKPCQVFDVEKLLSKQFKALKTDV